MGMHKVFFLVATLTLATSGAAVAATAFNDVHPIVISAHHASLDESQTVVTYSDLKLNGMQGQRALMSRVSSAIDSLCVGGTISVTDPVTSLKCQRDAWNTVRPQLVEVMPAR